MTVVSGTVTTEMVSQEARKYIFAAALTTGVTLALWLLRDVLTPANFSVIYLLGVLVVAVSQGTRPSLMAALLSFLCFNFFLLKPVYTFFVADLRELLDLAVFLVCATITGQLASYARQQTEAVRQHASEQNLLYELTSAFNQLTDAASVHHALQQILSKIPSVRQIDILPYADQSTVPDQVELYLLLRAGETVYGVLRVVFDKSPASSMIQLMTACAVQASLVLQRVELNARAQRSKNFEEADRLKTALLHAVSHDLRTPITIIKTSASTLLTFHQTLPDSERVDMLTTIENESDELNKMVDNLLDMSRLKAGALQINRDLNSLEEVVGDVAARVWQLTHQERIKISFPDAMPLVSFDYGLILRAFSNIVENTLRYEPPGRQVEIRGSVVDNQVQVAMCNHGPTIPSEERDLITEPFFHGKDGNIGLGLAIAKGIIEAHCGQLWIDETPGGGATFVVSLPINAPSKDGSETDEDSRCR